MEEHYLVKDGLVEQLHALLAEALTRTRQDAFGTPVTVAEIYQDLVPYRHVRSILGFQMNADYEHTLLRMLAGENGLARLEPETARDELRAELDTPNPNVGLFRKFAACDVWVEPSSIQLPSPPGGLELATPPAQPARAHQPSRPAPPPPSPAARSAAPATPPAAPPVPKIEPEPEPEMSFEDVRLEAEDELVLEDVREPGVELVSDSAQDADQWEEAVGELLLDDEVEAAPAVEVVAPGPDTAKETVPPAPAAKPADQRAAVMFESNANPQSSVATAAGDACAFCTKSLPDGRTIRYCPHCGADQSMKPCASCREALEPGWTFCIACGSRQG